MTPTHFPRIEPLSPVTSAAPPVDTALRLMLNPVLDRRTSVDGMWWPYSRDLAAELPGLIAAVDRLAGRPTLRVGVHFDGWDDIPRRVPARGRQIRVGWFRHGDPRLITLSFVNCDPIILLVIPPDAVDGSGKATTGGGHGLTLPAITDC